MTNPFNLTGKKILLFGGSLALDKAIIQGIEEHDVTLVVFEEHDINAIEQQVKLLSQLQIKKLQMQKLRQGN